VGSTGQLGIINPLPQRYVTDDSGIAGRIKVRPEDFLVDELPLYELDGEGEHLYLGVEKTNVAHAEMMSCLRRHFNVHETAIGFAGMKDKVGVTRQAVSIHLLGEPHNLELEHQRIKILWSARHRNKMRLGHLAGNRFSIRIRDVEATKVPLAKRTLTRLEEIGVPNYFGVQRFGYRCNNHMVGAALLRSDWQGMLAQLLGTTGPPFPEYQRQRREMFDAGRFAEAAELWTVADRAERIACSRLAQGQSHRDACLAVGPTSLSFWISALQSAIFNRVLDRRLEAGALTRLVGGDLAWKHDSRAVFRVTADALESPELGARLANLEISPSGPMWGRGMLQTEGETADAEREALEAMALPVESFLDGQRSPEGARRPLRCPISNSAIEAGVDEHGSYIRIAFDLPRGTYATIVLREIMKSDLRDADEQGEL
jgi:tRNA pseudouridine13 synthase